MIYLKLRYVDKRALFTAPTCIKAIIDVGECVNIEKLLEDFYRN